MQVRHRAIGVGRIGRHTGCATRTAKTTSHDGYREKAAMRQVTGRRQHQLGAHECHLGRSSLLAVSDERNRQPALGSGRPHNHGFQPIAAGGTFHDEKGGFLDQPACAGPGPDDGAVAPFGLGCAATGRLGTTCKQASIARITTARNTTTRGALDRPVKVLRCIWEPASCDFNDAL